jgi:hypothetical protein
MQELEVELGRNPYKSEKRRKELARLKKQEEKRQKRLQKSRDSEPVEPEGEGSGNADSAAPENAERSSAD